MTAEFSNIESGLALRAGSIEARYALIKPIFDPVLAALLLVLLAPVNLIVMVLVWLTSRGSTIYAHVRLAMGGRLITIYKIRTMYRDCERETGPTWSLPGDPRVTPLGRFLRWSHLDELPQLVNIIRGQMRLVGPRLERPALAGPLERALPGYRRRLTVRPGLTGLAQVLQPPDTDLSSVRRKLEFDLNYLDRMSPWLDLRVLLAMMLKCAGVPYAAIGRILRLCLQPVPYREEPRASGPELPGFSPRPANLAPLLRFPETMLSSPAGIPTTGMRSRLTG
jgi:lipopolysaccharide/colanic/teichoic acid biosynthesis glycosyltransferase